MHSNRTSSVGCMRIGRRRRAGANPPSPDRWLRAIGPATRPEREARVSRSGAMTLFRTAEEPLPSQPDAARGTFLARGCYKPARTAAGAHASRRTLPVAPASAAAMSLIWVQVRFRALPPLGLLERMMAPAGRRTNRADGTCRFPCTRQRGLAQSLALPRRPVPVPGSYTARLARDCSGRVITILPPSGAGNFSWRYVRVRRRIPDCGHGKCVSFATRLLGALLQMRTTANFRPWKPWPIPALS